MFTTNKLSFSVFRKDILKEITFQILPGDLAIILGPSGCGKSTLLKCLGGMQSYTGEAVFHPPREPAKLITAHDPELTRLIGFVPQSDVLHKQLTPQQALTYTAQLRLGEEYSPTYLERQVELTLRIMDLTESKDTKIKQLSGGQQKRVSLGMELLADPISILLDEPTAGLDPALEEQVMHQLKQLTRTRKTIIASTHILDSLNLADIVIVLHDGYLVFAGSPPDLHQYFSIEQPRQLYKKLSSLNPKREASSFSSSSYFMKMLNRNKEGKGF